MARFEDSLLQRLDRADEVQVRTRRADGSSVDLPIWIVTVDGEPFVRSFRAERGAWYRRAREEGRLTLVAGQRVDAVVEHEDDPELNRRISEAFTAKYGTGGPARAMVSPPVAATTLRLVPPP
ncbi:MAG: DUF2255 family protein [Candidatus Dormibacteraeota bacterium]|nr:DUF2255 family protein [Candidatus Dormibacteraeota bacterium]